MRIPSKIYCGFDWKQAELHYLGLYSKDSNLKEALESSDVHRYVASMVFSKQPEGVTKDERELAKTLSYALIYSSFNLDVTAISLLKKDNTLNEDDLWEVLQKYSETFFGLFSWVKESIINWYENDGMVNYFYGAKKQIRYPDYYEPDLEKLSNSKEGRVAINTYGQNSVGLLLKFVYSNMYQDSIIREHTSQHIPIFDSMNFLVDVNYLDEVVKRIDYFATPVLEHDGFQIRMQTDWKFSTESWGEMKEIDIKLLNEDRDPLVYSW